MKRHEIEQLMRRQCRDQIDIIFKQDDELAMYCSLRGGILYDCWNHRVDRKVEIWGYLEWADGRAKRVAFAEVN